MLRTSSTSSSSGTRGWPSARRPISRRHPERTLVVLAGSGHVEYGQGIPSRLTRRLDVPTVTILNGTQRSMDPAAADFFLYPQEIALPASGLLGVMLESGIDKGGARVQGFAESSGAKDAGIQEGDRIVQIGDQAGAAPTPMCASPCSTRGRAKRCRSRSCASASSAQTSD